MTRITFVIPYKGLDPVVSACLTEFADAPVTFETTHLIGVQEVRAYRFDTDIVVARGITYSAIREQHPELTVVEIPVTGYDVLRAIDEARRTYAAQKLALIGARNMVSGAHDLSRFVNAEVALYMVNQEQDAEAVIRRAFDEGMECVIGGLMAHDMARAMGLPATWIRSGEDAIRQAARDAVLAAGILTRERERAEFFNVVMDYAHEAILAVDQGGRVTTANRTAHRILGSTAESLAGQDVREIAALKGLTEVLRSGQEEVGVLQGTPEGMIAANFVPILVGKEVAGAVATFQPATSIQEVERRIRHRARATGLVAKYRFSDILGTSAAIQRAVATASRFSAVDSNVLIIGETGTGKELFAHSIHNASSRRGGPFVAVNCAALPEGLLESELFGYAEGAFTGASRSGKAGLFELAHDGTIFLDEISEIPLTLQAKLLRVLQEREIMRIGGDRVVPVDVRVIAAANQSLRTEVRAGRFRTDILYRIDVLRVNVPPLRQREQDVILLVEHYLKQFCRRFRVRHPRLTATARGALSAYSWPGNVRELINVCERVAVLAAGGVIDAADVAAVLEDAVAADAPTPEPRSAANRTPPPGQGSAAPTAAPLREVEVELMRSELARCNFNRAEAARRLGISRSTLWRRLKGGAGITAKAAANA